MVFSSISFLFYFLPAALILYLALTVPVLVGWRPALWRRLGNLFLFLASCLFYFWGEDFLLWIMLASTLIDYLAGLLIAGGYRRGEVRELEPGAPRSGWQRLGLVASIVSNLSFLGFFKYFNFFVESFNSSMAAIGLVGAQWEDVAAVTLPLGISFYTFQSMSYTIDVYRGEVKATRNLIDFACFVTMFPQLVAGPIVRYRDVATQLVHRVVSRPSFVAGVRRFVVGMAKKVLVANVVAKPADQIFALTAADLTLPVAWFGVVCYALQIYFDFSGYSDMAIGLGRMFGFDFPENFDYPYIARSIQDFWRRWHISLSTWFRDYLYIPLGGSRGSAPRTYANLVTVFFLCGLWHGAAWSFVVWGLFHGAFLVVEKAGLDRVLRRAPVALRHLYTVLVVLVGWVLFRAETLPHAGGYLAALVGLGDGDPVRYPLLRFVTSHVAVMTAVGVAFSAPLLPAMRRRCSELRSRTAIVAADFAELTALAVLMALVTVHLASGAHNPFIYFRF
jgi:alginate O-acetyltransferase complex protein AlgI